MKKLVLLVFLMQSIFSLAQQAVSTAGGTITVASGSFSFTVGQAAAGYFKNSSNSSTTGVQQTYASYSTQIQLAQCATVLAQLDTAILADTIDGAQKYRFEVSNGSAIRTIESVSNSFSLAQLEGGACFNTVYAIRVAVRYDGIWYDYGTACTLTTPDIAPTAAPQILCASSTVANLLASGTDIKWYAAATGGAALAASTALVTGTYYASQTINGCESSRIPVSVIVTPATIYYADNDGDGFGNPAVSQQSCIGAPTGYVTNNTDCNDTNNAATTAIVISNQPTSTTICKVIGGAASFTVATTAETATYQWYSQAATATTWTAITNNTNYSGATTATLNSIKTTTAVPATGTKYKVVATNSCGMLTSAIVTLTDLTVLSKAATVSVVGTLSPLLTSCQGNSVNLLLAAGSVGNIQWQSSTDGIIYSNVGALITQSALSATNATMPFNTGVLNQTTWFRVIASNGVCSSVNGTATKITVSSSVNAGIISGGDATVCAPLTTGIDANGNALTTAITNSTLLSLSDYTVGATILWQKSVNYTAATPTWATVANLTATTAIGASYSGAGTTALTVGNLAADTWYRALVTNGACSVATAVTKITVNKAAKAGTTTSATNGVVTTSVCNGGAITFTSTAYTGTAIQWEVSTTSATAGFVAIEGATGISFTMNNVSYAALSKFYVRSVVTSGTCTLARSVVKTITVTPSIISEFVQVPPICAGSSLNALPTTSTNGITGTWSPAINNLATTTYTFTPTAGLCSITAAMTITVTPKAIPTFSPMAAVCSGSVTDALPTTSLNGYTGTWSPALNNFETTEYTFTPSEGQCVATATMTIIVSPGILPEFTPVAPICAGSVIDALPDTSINGISGTWSPALNNNETTTYTFTPNEGQCANTITQTITITAPKVTSQISFTAPDQQLSIGMSYGGGKIIYIFQPGDEGYVTGQTHGLIIAIGSITTTNAGNNCGSYFSTFACSGVSIGNTSTAMGTGISNTNLLAASCGSGTVASICDSLVENGYSDWFLPSKDELSKVYQNYSLVGGVYPTASQGVWSSSEVNSSSGYVCSFDGGGGWVVLPKTYGFCIKPLRKF